MAERQACVGEHVEEYQGANNRGGCAGDGIRRELDHAGPNTQVEQVSNNRRKRKV